MCLLDFGFNQTSTHDDSKFKIAAYPASLDRVAAPIPPAPFLVSARHVFYLTPITASAWLILQCGFACTVVMVRSASGRLGVKLAFFCPYPIAFCMRRNRYILYDSILV